MKTRKAPKRQRVERSNQQERVSSKERGALLFVHLSILPCKCSLRPSLTIFSHQPVEPHGRIGGHLENEAPFPSQCALSLDPTTLKWITDQFVSLLRFRMHKIKATIWDVKGMNVPVWLLMCANFSYPTSATKIKALKYFHLSTNSDKNNCCLLGGHNTQLGTVRYTLYFLLSTVVITHYLK